MVKNNSTVNAVLSTATLRNVYINKKLKHMAYNYCTQQLLYKQMIN